MNWIKVNGKWQEKTILKKSNQIERKQLENRRNKIIDEIKNTNKHTKVSKLKKSVNDLEKIQTRMNIFKKTEQKVACIIKGKGVMSMEKNACKKKGKIFKHY